MIWDDKEATHRNPFCLDHLVNGQPLLGVGLEAATDQLLGLVRHVRPKWFGEVELAELDSPFHSRGHGKALLGRERREPTQPGHQSVILIPLERC